MLQFTDLTEKIQRSLSKDIRQKQGIYFTPNDVRSRARQVLHDLQIHPKSILEPSFGTAEFLNDMNNMYPNAKLFGVEQNKEIFDQVTENLPYVANLLCMDFLEYKADPVDLIIGNPPYFVTKVKNPECMSGRGNIFILFLYKCLTEHLIDGGVLVFVLPTSLYNCAYYQKCREYISRNCTILHLENLNASFYDTSQNTCLLVLRKEPSLEEDFIYRVGDLTYITPYYSELRELTSGARSLYELGYKVKTGTIVWNQYKKDLDDEDGTLLIYSANIDKENELILDNLKGQKKQYIQNCSKPVESGPVLLITRGYGNSYQFCYTVVDEDEYYVENHLNVVYRSSGNVDIRDIAKSLAKDKTRDFIRYFTGNGALSKTELEKVFPIWL